MSNAIHARAYCIGDDVKALDIMPTRFKSSSSLSESELAKAAFADLDPMFAAKASAGEYGIVIAGHNFGGGGKTIEGPVFALRGAGIRLVVAEGFARYFLRNAINNGFPVLICTGISKVITNCDQLAVDIDTALIRNLTSGIELQATPLSVTALEILAAGGLVPYAKKKLIQRGT